MSINNESFLSLGKRLTDERTRLGLSQAKLGELCGTSREMIGKYENGKTTPGGEVLFLLAKAGVDVNYILTGVRVLSALNGLPPEGYEPALLNRRELKLIDNVRECAEEDRRLVEQLALRVSEAKHTEVTGEQLRKAG